MFSVAQALLEKGWILTCLGGEQSRKPAASHSTANGDQPLLLPVLSTHSTELERKESSAEEN